MAAPALPGRSVMARLGVLLVAVLGVWAAPPARAHTLLLASDPGPGGVVEGLDQATLTFSAELAADGHLVMVRAGDTEQAANRYEVVDGSTLVAHFDAAVAPGSHELAWQAVGIDGHRQSGLVAFTVSPRADPRPPAGEGQRQDDEGGGGSAPPPVESAAAPAPATSRNEGIGPVGVAVLVALAVVVVGGGFAWASRRDPTR